MQTVTVLETRGHTALVEWADTNGIHRAFIPAREVKNLQAENRAEVEGDILEQGIPYGEAWEMLPIGRLGAQVLAQALRGRGIWTFTDAKMRVQELRAALSDAYAKDLRTILEASRAEQ